jgi:serine/threonine-protein kinase RsbT
LSIIEQRILPILKSYVSNINAQVMVSRAMRELGITPERLTEADLGRVCQSLSQGLDLFVEARHRSDIAARLDALTRGESMAPQAVTVPVRVEADISVALLETRKLCELAGARSFPVQKVTTIVSELARNVVNYTPGGEIQLSLTRGARSFIEIVAIDSGSGVPDLALVLSGKYKSRTGMGRGLIGCKRLSDEFEADTGPSGTRVRTVITL